MCRGMVASNSLESGIDGCFNVKPIPVEETQVLHNLDGQNFTRTKMAKMGFAWVSTKSSAGMLWLLAWCLCGNPHSEKRCSSDSLNCSWNSFLPIELPFPDSVWGLLPFVLYLVWSFLAVYSWRFVLFWRGNGAGRVDLGKREGRLNLWGLEGRKTVVRRVYSNLKTLIQIFLIVNAKERSNNEHREAK